MPFYVTASDNEYPIEKDQSAHRKDLLELLPYQEALARVRDLCSPRFTVNELALVGACAQIAKDIW